MLAAWLNNPELTEHLTLLGIFILLMMASAVLEIVITARGQYGRAAWTFGLSDVTRAVCFFAGALIAQSIGGLLVAAIVFAALRLAATLVYVVRTFGREMLPDGECLREQLMYAAPFSLAVLLEYVYRGLHQYAVSSQFDPATFAIYSVGCLQIPVIDTLSTSFANVLMVRMGEELAEGRNASAADIWRAVTRHVAMMMLGVAGLMVVVSRDLIVLLFTDAYAASAPIFIVTALTLVPGLFMTDSVLRVYAQTRYLVMLSAVRLVAVVVALVVLMPAFGLVGAAVAGLVAATIAKVAALSRMRRLMDVPMRAVVPWRSLGALSAAAVIAGLCAWLLPLAELPLIVRLALGSFVYLVVYGALVLWSGQLGEGAGRSLTGWLPARREKALATAHDR
jgi:O-antigen/teichoic acid export membrane protein